MGHKSTEHPIDARIAAIAARQHGLVTTGQLLELGLEGPAVAKRAKRGRLHRVHRGVYKVGYPGLTRNGRFMAAVLACGHGSALSHLSAAVLWGILADRGTTVHVTAETRRRVRGIAVHEAPLEGERVRREGIVVTTPARTLVDLADVVSRRALERALDEAEYLALDRTGLESRHGRTGSGLLTSVLAVHTPGTTRTRSELEEMFLALCEQQSLPRPEVNVGIEGYECDFVWRDARLVVETDGAAAHGTTRAKERDPIRDAELQLAGWLVIRVTWVRLLNRPEEVAGQVRRALTPPRLPAAPASPRPP
jgi:very-short-patch-repair endonuclease/predicted transcriptional regulator of viral defense system